MKSMGSGSENLKIQLALKGVIGGHFRGVMVTGVMVVGSNLLVVISKCFILTSVAKEVVTHSS